MANMTLSVPADLLKAIKRHSEINWSEVARKAFREKTRDLELMEKLTSKSRMSQEDVMELDNIIKRGSWEMHKSMVK